MQDDKWMNYISLYSELIKKGLRGGPHRVAVFNMLWTHCLDGIICLIILVNSSVDEPSQTWHNKFLLPVDGSSK